MTDADTNKAVIASDLGKEYILGGAEQYHDTFRDLLRDMLTAPFRKFKKLSGNTDENLFWALRNIDFEIPAGQVTGIIGRNGAGKSTLLKILSRITTPTTGQVEIRGRVASLLEVGSGFHPELTGRENIYMNASILGMNRREVHRKLDDIVQFAEVEQFLDTPVKRYSSGMYVRLAFSVAAHVDPDVLLVDEVLAVGDAKFQQRCIGKLNEVGQQGRTVMFVSHNMNLIKQLCSHSIYLKDGQIAEYGKTPDVLERYLGDDLNEINEWQAGDEQQVLRKLWLSNESRPNASGFNFQDQAVLHVEFCPDQSDNNYSIGIRLSDDAGRELFTSLDSDSINRNTIPGQLYRTRCYLPRELIRPGNYYVSVILQDVLMSKLTVREEARVKLQISDVDCPFPTGRIGIVAPRLTWQMDSAQD